MGDPWGEPVVFERRYAFTLPRPDRLYARLLRRRRADLDEARVRSILSAYGLSLLRMHAAPIAPGARISIAVETSAGLKVLKRYGIDAAPEALAHEHSILRRLEEVGFPAPRLARTPDGETIVSQAGRSYVLFDYLAGYLQPRNHVFVPSQARALTEASGRALGHLHLALRDFEPAGHNVHGFESRGGGRWRGLAWHAEQLAWFGREAERAAGPNERALCREIARSVGRVDEALRKLDESLTAASPPRLIIHADYGPQNLLFKPGEPVVILDFELARLDWRLADLALALRFFAVKAPFGKPTGLDRGRLESLVGGYAAAYPLERGELGLLPTVWQYMILRQLVDCCYRFRVYRERKWLLRARRWLSLFSLVRDDEASLATSLAGYEAPRFPRPRQAEPASS